MAVSHTEGGVVSVPVNPTARGVVFMAVSLTEGGVALVAVSLTKGGVGFMAVSHIEGGVVFMVVSHNEGGVVFTEGTLYSSENPTLTTASLFVCFFMLAVAQFLIVTDIFQLYLSEMLYSCIVLSLWAAWIYF